MARFCQITNKKPMVGNKRSHAMNATKRRFLINIKYHRFWISSEKKFIKLKTTTKGIKNIDKKGITPFLKKIKLNKQKK